MSTQLQSLQEQIKAELAAMNKRVPPPAGNRISLQGKVFTLPGGQTHQGPLTCVVLDHRNFNRYYTRPYDPQNPVSPECFAIAKEFAELSPHHHDDVPDPQAESCAVCPMNVWGSAATGKGKACRNMVRLAVAAVDADADADPMTLEVPPTALKHWAKYANALQTFGQLPVQVVTDIAFDPKAAYPCPTFKAVETHDALETFWALREKAQALLEQSPATS